jgi:ABC-type methionine transport system permease subunit
MLVGSVPNSNSNLGDAIAILATLLNCLPFVLNILVFIFFVFTRYWIALGMLGAFGASLLLTLCATVVFAAICFSAMGYRP